jgi:hypothetical protein
MPKTNKIFCDFLTEIYNKDFTTGKLLFRLTDDKPYFTSLISLQFLINSENNNDFSEFKKYLIYLVKKFKLRTYWKKYRFSISAINENNYYSGEDLYLIDLE